MDEEQLKSKLNNYKLQSDPVVKEALLAALLKQQDKKENILFLNFFNIMDKKYLWTGVIVLLLFVVGAVGVQLYSTNQVAKNIVLAKVVASELDSSLLEKVESRNNLIVYKIGQSGYYAATKDGETGSYYVWADSEKDVLNAEILAAAKLITKGDYNNVGISYNTNTGSIELIPVSDNGGSQTDSSSNSNQGTGSTDDDGDLRNDDNPVLIENPAYAECVATSGSMIRESYPAVCVLPSGEEVVQGTLDYQD